MSDAVVGDEIVNQVRFNVSRGVYKAGLVYVLLPLFQTDDASTAAVTVSRNVSVVSTAATVVIGAPATAINNDGTAIVVTRNRLPVQHME